MTYYQSLPKVLRDELARAPRGSELSVPSEPVRELIAEAALTSGIRPKGAILTYVVRRLRNGLGLGDFPTPPDLKPGETAYVDARIAELIADLRKRLGADQAGAGARLNVNPDGYTNPDNVTPGPRP